MDPKYCTGYWLTVDGMVFVQSALCSHSSFGAPMSADQLRCRVTENDPSYVHHKHTVLVNTDSEPGVHWMGAVVDPSCGKWWIRLRDWLPTAALSSKVHKLLSEVASVTLTTTGEQTTTWHCGYFGLLWQLVGHLLHAHTHTHTQHTHTHNMTQHAHTYTHGTRARTHIAHTHIICTHTYTLARSSSHAQDTHIAQQHTAAAHSTLTQQHTHTQVGPDARLELPAHFCECVWAMLRVKDALSKFEMVGAEQLYLYLGLSTADLVKKLKTGGDQIQPVITKLSDLDAVQAWAQEYTKVKARARRQQEEEAKAAHDLDLIRMEGDGGSRTQPVSSPHPCRTHTHTHVHKHTLQLRRIASPRS